MVATIDDGESAADAAKKLQAQAEGLVEDHKQGLLRSIEELYQLTERQSEMRGLQRELERAQLRMDDLRKQHPELIALPAPGHSYKCDGNHGGNPCGDPECWLLQS